MFRAIKVLRAICVLVIFACSVLEHENSVLRAHKLCVLRACVLKKHAHGKIFSVLRAHEHGARARC